MSDHLFAAICTLNSKYIHSSLAPWCLLAGVRAYCENGIDAEVAEGTINEPVENAAQRILEKGPQVIGLCCYIWNITQTKRLMRLIKERLPNSVIILGGPEVSYCAEKVLREEPLADYVISGEGERPFALLLNALKSNQEISDIPGLCYRKNGQFVCSEPYIPEEEPPNPYTQEYLNALKGRIAYLETSRGCPYRCAFCLSGRCGGARFYGMERAKKELLLLANSGTQTVKFVDRTFNANRSRAIELFHFIIDNYGSAIPKGVCFHFEIAGDILDDETIALLAKVPLGAIQLEIGLQSFHEQTLSAIHRKTDTERLKNNIARLLQKGNMHIHIDLIAGLPYEDLSLFAKSFHIAYALKPNMLQLGFLKLLYGAPMREEPQQYPCTYSEAPPYEVTSTPWISQQELQKLHSAEDALERLYNSGRFRGTLDYILKQTGKLPFHLFWEFGQFCAEKMVQNIPLDAYTALVFDYFSGQNGVERAVLRDMMVCDRLASNASGKLPAALRVRDKRLKHMILRLEQNEQTRPKPGVKRGAAILYTESCIVYADYRETNKNPVTGAYPLVKIKLSDLQDEQL